MTEIIIVALFLIFIGYREWLTHERIKDLELKAFTRDPQEYAAYKNIAQPVTKPQVEEDDDLVDPLDVNAEDALKGME
jgi:hypothetical protein